MPRPVGRRAAGGAARASAVALCCLLFAAVVRKAEASAEGEKEAAEGLEKVYTKELEEQIAPVLTENIDKAEDKAEDVEIAAEDNSDKVQESLDSVADYGTDSTGFLVKAAANDTNLPTAVVAGDESLLRAEAAVQNAKSALRIAEANREIQQKLLDQNTFQVAQAEVTKATAEAVEQKEAVEVAKKEELDAPKKTLTEKVVSLAEHPFRRGSSPTAKVEAKKAKTKRDTVAGESDMLDSAKAAGLVKNKEFLASKEELKKDLEPPPSFISGFFSSVVFVAPVAAVVGFGLWYHHKRRLRISVQQDVWLG